MSSAPSDETTVYTVTEAARLARVSVQALRQRIQRGTVATIDVERDRRTVTAIEHEELARAYPHLQEADTEEVDHVLRGTPSPDRERLEELERVARAQQADLGRAKKTVLGLRKKLEGERELRSKLQGVVEDQERRLLELQAQRTRLEQRLTELDNREIFHDVQEHEELRGPWWRSGLVWMRIGVVAVVLATAFAAGGAYWSHMDEAIERGVQRIEERLVTDPDAAPANR